MSVGEERELLLDSADLRPNFALLWNTERRGKSRLLHVAQLEHMLKLYGIGMQKYFGETEFLVLVFWQFPI